MSRSPSIFHEFGKTWYAQTFTSYSAFPRKLLVSSDFSTVGAAASAVYQSFITKLGVFLNAQVVQYNITQQFNMTSNTSTPLNTYLNTVRAHCFHVPSKCQPMSY